jgi:hypothetical protein
MSVLTVLTLFALLAISSLGIFMSGLAAIRQARLARLRSNLRLVDKLRARRHSSLNSVQQIGRFQ